MKSKRRHQAVKTIAVLAVILFASVFPAAQGGRGTGMLKSALAEADNKADKEGVKPLLSVDFEEEGVKRLVILPFDINSGKDLAHIRAGITQMFITRLFWKDHVAAVAESTEGTSPEKKKGATSAGELQDIPGLRNADYVLSGSITEFAGAFSVDAVILDLNTNERKVFFAQASKMERIIPQLNIIAAKINKSIFNRRTEVLAEFEEKEVLSKQKLKRMNPEKMMPYQRKMLEEKEKPFWMFWKFWD